MYFVDSIGFGGAERFLYFLLREALQRRKRVDGTVVYFYEVKRRIPFTRVPLIFISGSYIFLKFQQLLFLRRLIRNADLVHTQLCFSTILFRLLNLGIGKPSVTTLQNAFYNYRNLLIYPFLGRMKILLFRFLEIALMRDSDQIVAISRAVRRSFSSWSGVSAAEIQVVSNCIDSRFFLNSPMPLWRGFDKVLCIGRFVPEKNFFAVLEALSLIKKFRGRKLSAVFLGSGPLQASFQTFALTQGVSLYTPGIHEDIFNFLKSSQNFLFVHPSFSEGQGLVVLEAMAAGKPCLLSDIPAHREVAGKAAIYFNPKSAEDLANKILLLRSDLELGRCLAKLGKNRATKASPKVVCDKYLRIYQKTMRINSQ